MQFGAGSELAAQCVPAASPEGWRPWLPDADGPVPEALETRARVVAGDPEIQLGSTESFPLPGVTVLIRVEPRVWGRNEQGQLVQGCFRVAGVYLPLGVAAEMIAPPVQSKLDKTIGIFTVISLIVGTGATLYSWGRA